MFVMNQLETKNNDLSIGLGELTGMYTTEEKHHVIYHFWDFENPLGADL